MSVKLELVFAQPFTLIGLAIGYLVLKTGVIYGVARSFKLDVHPAKVAAMTVSQGGEFAFVLFGILSYDDVLPNQLLGHPDRHHHPVDGAQPGGDAPGRHRHDVVAPAPGRARRKLRRDHPTKPRA